MTNIKKLNDDSRNGMTLLELLIGIGIIMILIAGTGFQLRGLIQRAKVQAAKATINAFALCLGMVKADTGLYPLLLEDVNKADPPTENPSDPNWCGFSKDWGGPYGMTISFTDPWGTDYFYWLTDSTVFGPTTIERTTGEPYEETFIFPASVGPGTLLIANPGVSSGSVTLNGEEIVSQDEFQHIVPVIIKTVNLLASNTITIRLTSTPGLSIDLSISAQSTSKDAVFVLGSWGKNGEEGGSKFDGDIVYGYFR